MARAFVYNDGGGYDEASKDIQEIIQLGFFFDGTTNNMFNTELSQKIQKAAGYAEVDEQGNLTDKGIDAYDQYKQNTAEDIRKIPDIDVAFSPKEKQAFQDRNFLEPVSSYVNDQTNVVRIFQACDPNNYAVYIEGIGTKEYQEDNQEGYAMGDGSTGIKERAKEALDKFRKKVIEKNVGNKSKSKKKVILDVFGFSRGAATARHFVGMMTELFANGLLEELRQMQEYDYESFLLKHSTAKEDRTHYIFTGRSNELDQLKRQEEERIQKLEEERRIRNSKNIDSFWYKKGTETSYRSEIKKGKYVSREEREKIEAKIFKMGLSPSELKELSELNVAVEFRFMGLYDTVSSFSTIWGMAVEVIKDIKAHGYERVLQGVMSKSYFDNNEELLYMHENERVKKIVHFTALDEHRENFSLTRIKNTSHTLGSRRIEKNLPGVHSDIGGSYLNESEQVHIGNEYFSSLKELKHLYFNLLGEGWFKPGQLSLKGETMSVIDNIRRVSKQDWLTLKITRSLLGPISIGDTWLYSMLGSAITAITAGAIYFKNTRTTEQVNVLRGTRYLRKEYSYIPLHFMYEYFLKEIGVATTSSTAESQKGVNANIVTTDFPTFLKLFSIAEHPILIDAKERLRPYVMNEVDEEWRLTIQKKENELVFDVCTHLFGEEKDVKIFLNGYNDYYAIHIEHSSKFDSDEKQLFNEWSTIEFDSGFTKTRNYLSSNLRANDVTVHTVVLMDLLKKKDFSHWFFNKITPEQKANVSAMVDAFLVSIKEDQLLCELRNKYLHYSAHYDNHAAGIIFPMEPRANRIRQEFPK